MPEGISPNPEDTNHAESKGAFSKAKEFASELLHNLGGKSEVEGSGLEGDPVAEAKLAEARESSAADLDAYREQRREQLGIRNPQESQTAASHDAESTIAQPDPAEVQTQEAPDQLDKAA